MGPTRRRRDGTSERRFLLATTPEEGEPRLRAEDERHALTVLRLSAGDALVGMDGRGRAWPLVVRAVERRALVLEAAGPERTEPAPGAAGAALPHVTLGVSLPRGGRAEDMLDRLTQLGLAAVVPIVAEHTPPHARESSAHRAERLGRVAREACKQSGRLWLPEIRPAEPALDFLRAPRTTPLAVLSPGPPATLGAWAAEHAADHCRALRLAVGPEGGFTDEEHDAARAAGASLVRIAPYTLRIETAAEAAAAIVVHAFT